MMYQKKTSVVYATEEQKAKARRMFASGYSPKQIGAILHFHPMTVYFWLHPEKHENARKGEFPVLMFPSRKWNQAKTAEYDARLAEVPPDHRDLTGIICGDPVFERSALAQKRRA